MADDAATHEVGLVGDQPIAAPVLHQLRIARHGAEPALEGIVLERLHVEQFHQARKFQRRTLRGQRFENVFAARQRVIVLRLLALELGIGATDF
jgi:hypothetical protein